MRKGKKKIWKNISVKRKYNIIKSENLQKLKSIINKID